MPDLPLTPDYSEEQLRWMLVEKRQRQRAERLERFRRTGRALSVSTEPLAGAAQPWRTTAAAPEWGVQPSSRRRRWINGLLLLIELSAVGGFVYLLVSGMNLIRSLNAEVSTALIQPTLTPTPLIVAAVLPSGHTPPNAPGGAQFNEAEIPSHLRPLVQSLAEVRLPTPGPQHAIRIQIPALSVDAPVVQGDGWEQLKKGVGQQNGTANPGSPGNIILSAHNDIFGEIFRNLDRLKPGDAIILFTGERAYTYLVAGSQLVEPTAVEVLKNTKSPTVTLISCYPYMIDNQRIVVTARLKSEEN